MEADLDTENNEAIIRVEEQLKYLKGTTDEIKESIKLLTKLEQMSMETQNTLKRIYSVVDNHGDRLTEVEKQLYNRQERIKQLDMNTDRINKIVNELANRKERIEALENNAKLNSKRLWDILLIIIAPIIATIIGFVLAIKMWITWVEK